MMKWLALGTVVQIAMVVVGHQVTPVANFFGPLGMAISLAAGLLWARTGATDYANAAVGGMVIGGGCALVGILVSYLLGDVTAMILALGTISSGVTGALGGLLGRRFASRHG